MADKKISELTAASTVSATDDFVVVQGTVTNRLSAQTLFGNVPTDISHGGLVVDAGTPDSVASGAISVTTSITYLANGTAGQKAATLADGVQGQEKTLVMTQNVSDSIVITPTNFGNGTTLTFDAVGQTCKLKFMNSTWYIMSNNGATIA